MRTALWLLALMLALLVVASMPGLAYQVLAGRGPTVCPAQCPAPVAVAVAPCPAPAAPAPCPTPVAVAPCPAPVAAAPCPAPCPAPVAACPAPVPIGMPVACPTSFDLTPFLQAEVNEVAELSAQANCLRQAGDTLGADLIASFIPDHQMQVARLQCAMGSGAAAIQPTVQPFLGTQQDVLKHDLEAHMVAMTAYRQLFAASVGNPGLHQIATLGLQGASRHFDSITVASASAAATPDAQRAALAASLVLEKSAVADLSTQSEQLLALGDACNACLLMTQVAAHQQQVIRLSALLAEAGGDPTFVVANLAAPLNSTAEVMAAERVGSVQLVNTYAVPIAMASGPIRDAALSGQQIAMADLSMTGVTGPVQAGMVVPVASTFVPIAGAPGPPPTAAAAVPAG